MQAFDTSGVLSGPFRQTGFVVRDLDQAIASWLKLGIGPWYVLRGMRQEASYRGEPCSVPFSLAFSNSGDMQLELIHQEDDTPSIYTEFLQAHGEGMHQFAWWPRPDEFDAILAAAETAGWPVVWSGGESGSVRYAYLEPADCPATIIEISEYTESTEQMAKLVRDAAANWDGSDPIRTMG